MPYEHPSASVEIDAPIQVVWRVMVEEFSGPLVGLAGPERVAEGFRRHAEALRTRAEAVVRQSGLDH